MQDQYPQIEISVNTGNDEQNAAIEHLFDSYVVELVVKNTLQAAGITEPVTLTLLITSDDAIRDLNRQYRQQDNATDVLSFPLQDKPLVNAPADQLWIVPESEQEDQAIQERNRPVFMTPPELPTNLGDIVISWPTVHRQAHAAGHSSTYELLYLISHGLLHLVGYDDQNEAGYSAMVNIQQSVLEVMGQKA
jgi:probable rRNA maturation factor